MTIVRKVEKGKVTIVHSLIEATTTSAEISCVGYNAILVHTVVTPDKKDMQWTTKLQGCMTSGGTFVDWYDGATLMSFQTDSGKAVVWKGVPDFVKVVATEDADGGKATVTVQPLNV